MQAMDLHLEQAVGYKSPTTLNLQGSKTVSQDESAFHKELQRSQKAAEDAKDAQKAQEMPHTMDGNQKLNPISEEDSKGSVISEHEMSSNVSDLLQDCTDSLLSAAPENSKLEDSSNEANSTPEHISDEYFSVSDDEMSIELLMEQEAYVLQDEDILLKEKAFLLQNEKSITDSSMPVKQLQADEKEKRINNNDDDNLLIQSLLTGQITLDQYDLQSLTEGAQVNDTGTESADIKILGPSDEALISVIDERSITKEAAREGKFVTSITHDGNGNAQMTLSLPSDNLYATSQGVNSSAEMTSHERFGQMLSSELSTHAKEFVKTGSLILKDNNRGTINLILHPEELGNVKIRLELTDKVIAGKIVVSSEEAFNAFKSNLDSLRQAFTDSGFEAGGFDLSWNNEGQSGRGNEHNHKGYVYNDALPELHDEEYALQLSRDAVIYGTSVINMIA